MSKAEISVLLLSLSRLSAAAVNKRPGTSTNVADACSLEDPVDINLVDQLLSIAPKSSLTDVVFRLGGSKGQVLFLNIFLRDGMKSFAALSCIHKNIFLKDKQRVFFRFYY